MNGRFDEWIMRERIQAALKDAMLAKEPVRVGTLRLMLAAIKDRDIALRSEDGSGGLDEAELNALLSKMVRQREETARTYAEAGRLELAEREQAEIAVIREFMPKQLTDNEVAEAVSKAIKATGAQSIRDMGKVMGQLKTHYAGQMDLGDACARVKTALG